MEKKLWLYSILIYKDGEGNVTFNSKENYL